MNQASVKSLVVPVFPAMLSLRRAADAAVPRWVTPFRIWRRFGMTTSELVSLPLDDQRRDVMKAPEDVSAMLPVLVLMVSDDAQCAPDPAMRRKFPDGCTPSASGFDMTEVMPPMGVSTPDV